MSRQAELDRIWAKLLAVFVLLAVFGISAACILKVARVPTLVFVFGNLGAYVSMHRSLTELSDQEITNLSHSWVGLIVPSFVGGILSFVLYLLFISGLVAGDIFPHFQSDKTAEGISVEDFTLILAQHATEASDYAKLLFWSFVGGFNQKYAVDIIESVKAPKAV